MTNDFYIKQCINGNHIWIDFMTHLENILMQNSCDSDLDLYLVCIDSQICNIQKLKRKFTFVRQR